jgi:hypothetical protein
MTSNIIPSASPGCRAPVSRFPVLWAQIPDSNYEASNIGMIRHVRTKRVLVPWPDRDGYLIVNIRLQGRLRGHFVHRLVLLAFTGEPPTARHQAAHGDGCRQHNALWNLRWATPKENAADKRRHTAMRRVTVCARRKHRRHHQHTRLAMRLPAVLARVGGVLVPAR